MLPRTSTTAARSHQAEDSRRLQNAFQRVRTTGLDDEQTGDLPLHLGRNDDRARLSQRLHTRRDVRHIAVNFAGRVYHCRPSVKGDTGGKFGLSSARILAIELGECVLDSQRGAGCPLGIVLLGDWVAEQRHQRVTHFPGDVAAQLIHHRRSRVEIIAQQVAPVLGVQPRRNPGRIHQIAEHHGKITPLSCGFSRGGD